MSKKLYLYTDPFVEQINLTTKADQLLDFYTDADRQDQATIYALLLQFASDNGLITNVEGQLTSKEEENTGSWVWAVTWTNFRSMVEARNYHMLLNQLQSFNQKAMNQIIDLHARLGALFDHRLLNTIVNRTLSSVSLIPYPVDEDEETLSWENIHREAPFLWLVIFLQNVIRSNVKPIV